MWPFWFWFYPYEANPLGGLVLLALVASLFHREPPRIPPKPPNPPLEGTVITLQHITTAEEITSSHRVQLISPAQVANTFGVPIESVPTQAEYKVVDLSQIHASSNWLDVCAPHPTSVYIVHAMPTYYLHTIELSKTCFRQVHLITNNGQNPQQISIPWEAKLGEGVPECYYAWTITLPYVVALTTSGPGYVIVPAGITIKWHTDTFPITLSQQEGPASWKVVGQKCPSPPSIAAAEEQNQCAAAYIQAMQKLSRIVQVPETYEAYDKIRELALKYGAYQVSNDPNKKCPVSTQP
jgi:hypothetical protein